MADPAQEHVLVVPTSALWQRTQRFHGFRTDVEQFLPSLFERSQLLYLPRSQAEDDPSFKQLIPYVVLRWGEQVFHYLRGRSGTEARLRALRSLGVGGHISREDGGDDPYRAGMLRELAEEVEIRAPFTERIVGLINDDLTAVGQVHLGIVHVFNLAAPAVKRREDTLDDCGFASLPALRDQLALFETWSQFLLMTDVLCS